MSDFLRPHRLYPTGLLRPWDFPDKNTGVGCHFFLQEIFLTQGLNPGLPHCRLTLYRLSTREVQQLEEWRNNSRKNEETETKQKRHPVVDVTGDGRKVRSCKEQYCIRTWNIRSMNEGKLEVVKQEMARVNIDI